MSRQFLAGDVPRYSFCSSPYPMLPPLPWRFELDAGEHEYLLQGNLTVLGYESKWSPDRSTWHSAPDTGRTWPRAFFAEIPIREGNDYGDVRVAWEASRLQHLVALALLAQKAEPLVRERAVAVCEAQLLSWVEGNPFLTGIHYISPMECALRLLSVCYATDLIRPWLKARRMSGVRSSQWFTVMPSSSANACRRIRPLRTKPSLKPRPLCMPVVSFRRWNQPSAGLLSAYTSSNRKRHAISVTMGEALSKGSGISNSAWISMDWSWPCSITSSTCSLIRFGKRLTEVAHSWKNFVTAPTASCRE